MSRFKILIVALAALVVGATVLVSGIDRALEVTWYDRSLYITGMFVIYVVGDALRRALRPTRR